MPPTCTPEAAKDSSTTEEFLNELLVRATAVEEIERERSSRVKFPSCRAQETFELE